LISHSEIDECAAKEGCLGSVRSGITRFGSGENERCLAPRSGRHVGQ
jgi:hypothetical protein